MCNLFPSVVFKKMLLNLLCESSFCLDVSYCKCGIPFFTRTCYIGEDVNLYRESFAFLYVFCLVIFLKLIFILLMYLMMCDTYVVTIHQNKKIHDASSFDNFDHE